MRGIPKFFVKRGCLAGISEIPLLKREWFVRINGVQWLLDMIGNRGQNNQV
jgi:hypothetical protein